MFMKLSMKNMCGNMYIRLTNAPFKKHKKKVVLPGEPVDINNTTEDFMEEDGNVRSVENSLWVKRLGELGQNHDSFNKDIEILPENLRQNGFPDLFFMSRGKMEKPLP